MSQPQGIFGLEVPPAGVLIPAVLELPATIHISMAAIDPTAEPEADADGNVPNVGRSTLRIVRRPVKFFDDDDSEDDEEAEAYLHQLLDGSDDEDDEANGGPSDPAKARSRQQLRALLDATEDEDEDDEDDEMVDADAATNGKSKKGKQPAKTNGAASKASKKGKEPATEEEEEDDEDEDDDDEDEDDEDDDDDLELEDFVICTLDTERLYQQPIELTIEPNETVFFTVSGSHSVHLTGNYIVQEDDDEDDEEDSDDEYDLPPDVDLEELDSDEADELDELDALTDRIEEINSDEEEEAPKLVESKKKGKKRSAEETEESLDDLIAAASNGKEESTKLSKKQQKKLKNNQGEAVEVAEEKDPKKVKFAKNLEQGPTGPGPKKDAKETKGKATLGVKVVSGVTIDDRKLGTGRVVKSGDRVGMRYIGKLENGKIFDSNKKGAPFTFRVGKGEVIRGWDIGITGMSIGGERRLTIPPSLAYGSKKLDGIPANSTLIFDVKLLEIK